MGKEDKRWDEGRNDGNMRREGGRERKVRKGIAVGKKDKRWDEGRNDGI